MTEIKPRLGESKEAYTERVIYTTLAIDWMKHCLGDMLFKGDFTYYEELKETLDCQYASEEGEPNIVIENTRFWDLGLFMADALKKHRGFEYIDDGFDENDTRMYWKVKKGENIYEFSFRRTFGYTFMKLIQGSEDDFWEDFDFLVDFINDDLTGPLYKAYHLKQMEITKEPKENWYEKELAEAMKEYDRTMKEIKKNKLSDKIKGFFKSN